MWYFICTFVACLFDIDSKRAQSLRLGEKIYIFKGFSNHEEKPCGLLRHVRDLRCNLVMEIFSIVKKFVIHVNNLN